jgi:hypothetical protein
MLYSTFNSIHHFHKEIKMSYRILFLVNAFIALLAGLACLLVPAMVLEQFGAEARVPELLLARFFGSAMVTIGLLLWFAKDVMDDRVQRNLGLALLVGAMLGLIVTAIGVSPVSGVIRSNGWAAMLVYVLLAFGYAFLVFLKPRMKV